MTSTGGTTPNARYKVPQQWRVLGLSCICATLLVGLLYGSKQWLMPLAADTLTPRKIVTDGPLIFLVTLNTVIVYFFVLYLPPKMGDMLAAFPSTAQNPQKALNTLLGHRYALPFGVAYAAMIGGGARSLNTWGDNHTLNNWQALFLFCGSVIIGMAIFAVFQFWRAVLRDMPELDVRILNLSRAPLLQLLRVNSQIVTITALIASTAILSVVLTGYKMGNLIFLFSVFTLVLVLATYAVPIVPLSNRLRADKAAELDRIEQLIEAHVRALSGRPPRQNTQTQSEPDLDALIRARDLIAGIGTMPPGGQVSVSAASIVTFLSFMPAIVDYIVQNLF